MRKRAYGREKSSHRTPFLRILYLLRFIKYYAAISIKTLKKFTHFISYKKTSKKCFFS